MHSESLIDMETDHMGLIMTKEIKVYIRNFLLEELKIREIADSYRK